MKIVHVVLGKANPLRSNGVNRVAHGLASAQTHAGADVEIWGITPTPDAPTTRRSYTLRLFRTARRTWSLDDALIDALASAPRDAVFHFHGGYHPEFFAIARRLARRDLPWVLTPHGAYRGAVIRRRWLLKRSYVALVDGFVIRHARAVHVLAEREATDLLRIAPHARAVVLPNGVDLREYPFAARATRRTLVFGFCGRLSAWTKGLDALVDGFALHVWRSGAGELLIVGDGEDRCALEERARALGIRDRVQFTGTLYADAQRDALGRMDVFCHPSRTDGMPVAPIEAAATGLPCIVTPDTNLGESVERFGAGFMIGRSKPGDVADALARCELLWKANELSAVGRNARAMVEREFDAAVLGARSIDALYGCGESSTSRAA